MKFYISEGAVWLLVIFYAPLVLWLLWKLWRALSLNYLVRAGAMALALLIAVGIPLWDVIGTSLKMAKLCPQAGIFVNYSVKVSGFYTNFGSPDMLDRGFKYIENRSYGNRLVVYSKDGDVIKKDEFDVRKYQVKSRYEFINDIESGSYEGRRDIGIQRSVVRDRETNMELGYALRYYAYPGWVDRNTLARIGQIIWRCEDNQDQNVQLLRRAILPRNGENK